MRSVGRLGADAAAAFRSARSLAGPEIAQLLTQFADDPVTSLRSWGMREIDTADGAALVYDEGAPYAPTTDLLSLARAVAGRIGDDVWQIDRATTGTKVVKVWLGRGDLAALDVTLNRIRACVSMSGRMAGEAPAVIASQYLLIYVVQAASAVDARAIAEAAGPGHTRRPCRPVRSCRAAGCDHHYAVRQGGRGIDRA
jgi:hypothetical protein